MPEKLTLTTPITVSDFDIARVDYNWRDSRITVEFSDTTGKTITAVWEGAQALTLMRGINKADCRTNTQRTRILAQAVSDNKLPAGTVTGSPD